ncbi:MAG TPA: glutathione S-transferase family protein [Ramlibacter sp.]|uniref:glutathione S-transferase family protein n=1 Tax=Ramlibacter sp. TaxID=1917967 RepID=UPI002BB104EC|nr:glutathione S-transferase family protein [Ramlibacter sp.]HVZ43714.1 glutathione S-transferase family protein [Ramlibacter sp.]
MLTLYYAPGTCALATHFSLERAGADYRTVAVDFRRNEQRSPDYLKVNPKGRVPALVTERGTLTETPALLMYVAQRYPKANLGPIDDPFELARMNEFNAYMCATVHVAHAHKGRGYRWVDDPAAMEAMKQKVPQTMSECFTLIEERFFKGPWVLGEKFSASDYYLFTISRWLEGDGVDVARFPKVLDHRQRLARDELVQRVIEAQRPAAA